MNILHFDNSSAIHSMAWCVYSHFDKNNKIQPYVLDALKNIKKCGLNIILVSTSDIIAQDDLLATKKYADIITTRENIGYDFGSYKLGIKFLTENQILFNQILITNDSVFGPIFDIGPFLENSKSFDLYGLTDSIDYFYHIQSYFIIYNEKVLKSPYFMKFWDSVELIDSTIHNFKNKIIQEYEVGGTQYFIDNGFKVGVEFGISHIAKPMYEEFNQKLEYAKKYSGMKINQFQIAGNPTHNYWKILLRMGYPYLKRELLSSNPTNTDINDWPKYLNEISSYNVDYIIDALLDLHGHDNFIFTTQSLEYIIENMNEKGEIKLPINNAFLKSSKISEYQISKEFYFDEDYYLSISLDVKASIERGEMASGLAHFLSYGLKEQRRYRLTSTSIKSNSSQR
jgi:lipopolysaccharide biosynthesis protein